MHNQCQDVLTAKGDHTEYYLYINIYVFLSSQAKYTTKGGIQSLRTFCGYGICSLEWSNDSLRGNCSMINFWNSIYDVLGMHSWCTHVFISISCSNVHIASYDARWGLWNFAENILSVVQSNIYDALGHMYLIYWKAILHHTIQGGIWKFCKI